MAAVFRDRSAEEIGDVGNAALIEGGTRPLRHELSKHVGIPIISRRAADEQVVTGAADERAGVCAGNQDIPSGAAIEHVAAVTDHNVIERATSDIRNASNSARQ